MRTTAPGRRWTARSALRRSAEVARSQGLRTLLFKALGETVYRRALLVRLDLDELRSATSGDVRGEFLADADELGALESPTPVVEARERLSRGLRCYVQRDGGRVVSARWVATGTVLLEYLGRPYELRPGEAFVYESFTHPDYRGRALSRQAAAGLARELAAEGFTALVAVVVPENASGLRAAEKAGFEPVGVIGWVRLGRRRLNFERRLAGSRRAGRRAARPSPRR